jgi:acyl carrier protein
VSLLSERDGNVAGMADLERDVRAFLRDNFILDGDDLPGDASLTQHGVLDSMGVLELIMFVEERFGVKIPDEDTLPEHLDSVDRIVRYVEGRLGAVRG